MSSYETLAGCYDELTEDVAYTKRADFIEKLMGGSKIFQIRGDLSGMPGGAGNFADFLKIIKNPFRF